MATSAQSASIDRAGRREESFCPCRKISFFGTRFFIQPVRPYLRLCTGFTLYVHEYDERTGDWEKCGGVSIYDGLEAVKKSLFYEYDFYCEETAGSDKFGDEIYKENLFFEIVRFRLTGTNPPQSLIELRWIFLVFGAKPKALRPPYRSIKKPHVSGQPSEVSDTPGTCRKVPEISRFVCESLHIRFLSARAIKTRRKALPNACQMQIFP